MDSVPMFEGLNETEWLKVLGAWDGVRIEDRLRRSFASDSPVAGALLRHLRQSLASPDRHTQVQTARFCCQLGPLAQPIAMDLLNLSKDDYHLCQLMAIRAILFVGVPQSEAEAVLLELKQSEVKSVRQYVDEAFEKLR